MLWLHIGAFKTGSSAIQAYLRRNRAALSDMGVFYAVRGARDGPAPKISSGNGVPLARLLAAQDQGPCPELDDLLDFYIRGEHRHCIISSELLAEAKPVALSVLKAALSARSDVRVLVLVRNVYDHAVSLWHQLIKRHGYTKTLVEFCRSYANPQVRTLRTYAEIFGEERLTVVHYDTVADRLIPAVFDAMGLEPPVPPDPAVVNRSLNEAEVEVLAACNAIHGRRIPLATRLSDYLIYKHPDRPKTASLDPEALDLVTKRCAEGIGWLNAQFFGGRPVLQITSATTADPHPPVPREAVWRDVFEAMDGLIQAQEAQIRRLAAADLIHRARSHLRAGEAVEAGVLAAQALDLDPVNETARAVAAKASARAGGEGFAAIRMDVTPPEPSGVLSLIPPASDLSDATAGEQAWRNAFRMAVGLLDEREAQVTRLEVLDLLGRAEARMIAGQNEAARRFADQALGLDPSNTAAREILAQALELDA